MIDPRPPRAPMPRVIDYEQRQVMSDPRVEQLSPESQAALRQFSEDRLIGYGVERADAGELRERVLRGVPWKEAATMIADRCRTLARPAETGGNRATRITYLRRASALVRASQVMMLTDTPERAAIYARAGDLYGLASHLAGDRRRVLVHNTTGELVGWHFRTRVPSQGAVLLIGGVEGYAMDFDSMGEALAARGIETLALDGPGQGESRFTHEQYLSGEWRSAYIAALDYLSEVSPGRPIGIIGNSMGGSFAMAVAASDTRVRACVDNGGIPAPWLVTPSVGTFFTKMVSFCGTGDPEEAIAVWSSVVPLAEGANGDYSLLVLHGGADPLVTQAMAEGLWKGARTANREMVIFSDGDHCIYNHKTDRDILVADWMFDRLSSAQEEPSS
ncbi:alpha/beta hydrolase family protein [Microbacterium sp.]|uniref:alpha/beta hydrolase family protein n=1 Tax=Microbacterium sp. TaxID=51671 RepID=UPI003567E1B2